jgi:hypothetical protein
MNSENKALSFVRENLDSILASVGAILSLVLIIYLQIHIARFIYTITAILCFYLLLS